MGDPAAFRRLFEAHGEALRRYAHRIVCSRDAAEDLVQEVFFRLWRAWDTVETGPGIRAYLYVATRSRALNHLARARSEDRGRHLHVAHAAGGGMSAVEPEGDANIAADEIVRAIEHVLGGMPPRQREVAALRLRHQLSTAAIAARLGISPRTVEVHVARATKALREQLPALLE